MIEKKEVRLEKLRRAFSEMPKKLEEKIEDIKESKNKQTKEVCNEKE